MILEKYEWGDPAAPPLVLIHGVGSRAEEFAEAAQFWGAERRVIAFDLRGHNRSGFAPPWSHATYVEDLVESVRALGIARADWLGFSFGGSLLLKMAVTHPEVIDRSILLEPVIKISPELADRRAQEELTGDVWDSVEDFIRAHSYGAEPNFDDADRIATYFDALPDGRVKRRTSQTAIVSIFSEFAADSPPPETLAGGTTALLYAPAFGLVQPDQLEAYRPYLERVVALPGMHSVFQTAFAETTAAVTAFLNETESTA
ncbi:MAG: alpha/beta fold hydrolase [Leucobacter sp.]|nr:alpha/beta fold hydrolase [Leucobacter sp.]